MRVNAKWTSSGIVLWLIAAGIASLVVCTGATERRASEPLPAEVEFDVEVTE